jgi:hypothetical protein
MHTLIHISFVKHLCSLSLSLFFFFFGGGGGGGGGGLTSHLSKSTLGVI